MAEKSLEWNGKAVTERMRQAQIAGINRTMGASVQHARDNHTWQNRTGVLEGGIDIVDYAAETAEGAKGVWGVHDVRYALIHELGGTIEPVNAKALAIPQPDGGVRLVKKVTIRAQPYLRPAADAKYPSLADNIRKAYEKSAPKGGGTGG
ncbi:hypothetical protein SAMN02927924_01697 [Sphingobium faniae]|nr:hypothetical protein SAMN02927924_01697 [Sphingobium faniae]